MTGIYRMYPRYTTYQAGYNWCPGEKEEILAPEVRVSTYAGTFILADEAIIRLPGEKARRWGEIKAKLERKPPFPSPFAVEVVEFEDETAPWLCNPTEIARDIEELEGRVKEIADKLSRRNRQIEDLRKQLAAIK